MLEDGSQQAISPMTYLIATTMASMPGCQIDLNLKECTSSIALVDFIACIYVASAKATFFLQPANLAYT